jgi:SAM-dependent methyltransferase
VSGCDISATAIEKARALAPECQFLSIDLKDRTSFPDSQYDVLLALHVLCYFTDEEIHHVVQNLSSLLASGGFVLAGHHLPKEMNFGRYMRDLSDACRLFASHGFGMRLGLDMSNELDQNYAGEAVGRNIYFLVQKEQSA